ncbi:MAG: AIR synthase family protein [Candidatus Bathyarchaeota archaeon]|nr:MAG: AIR synthase family protein [Candidatus Bathyarchaeota archaeon]
MPKHILQNTVFSHLGVTRKEVVVGPTFGVDGAVIKLGEKTLITSMDPITGAIERIGWLAVNISANDVSTFGVEPAFFSSCLLLPETSSEETIATVCRQMDIAAKKLNTSITGGHSEVTPRLTFPIVVGCCIGVTEKERYVTSKGAKPGDLLILTKSVGIEGTAILATDRFNQLLTKLPKSTLLRAQRFFDDISVVNEAILAFKTGCVTAMHDPTEGGVVGGIIEMAAASGVGFRVFEDAIPITKETKKISKFFGIDPLQLIASGSLLISTGRTHGERVLTVLRESGVEAAAIGEFLPSIAEREIVRYDGRIEQLTLPLCDHLWLALEKSGDSSEP